MFEKNKIYEKLLVIKPCHTKGKLMAEINFDESIDLKKIESSVIKIADIKNVLYSSDLGLVKYTIADMNVFVFENGFVRVKNALNKNEIVSVIEFLKQEL
ncbi:MAG: hypothetical protein KAS12_03165 [Candidatus Aenigmarchaeota archaeon]|nr:hypothetical protein [Candidatus Aenigmarchaeota archaeon]